jgi:hypothetical protein
MRHHCQCDPAKTYIWTHAELQAAHEAHPKGFVLGHRKWSIINQRQTGKPLHAVRFVEER